MSKSAYKKWGIVAMILGVITVLAGVFAAPVLRMIQLAVNGPVGFIGVTSVNVVEFLWMHFGSYFWLRLIGYQLIIFAVVFLVCSKKKQG